MTFTKEQIHDAIISRHKEVFGYIGKDNEGEEVHRDGYFIAGLVKDALDNFEQRQEAGPPESIVIGTAADEWQKGDPEESGRYLVEYQQGRVKRVFVMDYDAFEERWLTHATEVDVLRWAKINSEYH